MKDLLKTSDLSRADFKYLLARAVKFKAKPHQRRTVLQNDSVALYFNKPFWDHLISACGGVNP